MQKKDKKGKPHEQLADDERELFLNAYYQGGFITKDTNKEDYQAASIEEPVLDEDERALFVRAVEEGIIKPVAVVKLHEPPVKRPAKRRSLVDATIDLHGMVVDDAVKALLRFLEQEKRRGSKTLLVVHGKGSGVLKNAMWSLIDSHPFVADSQVAPGKLGGEGALIVRINRNVKRT